MFREATQAAKISRVGHVKFGVEALNAGQAAAGAVYHHPHRLEGFLGLYLPYVRAGHQIGRQRSSGIQPSLAAIRLGGILHGAIFAVAVADTPAGSCLCALRGFQVGP